MDLIANANPNWITMVAALITMIATIGTGILQIKAQAKIPAMMPPDRSQIDPVKYPFSSTDRWGIAAIVLSLVAFLAVALLMEFSKLFVVLECLYSACFVLTLGTLLSRIWLWHGAVAISADIQASQGSTAPISATSQTTPQAPATTPGH